MNTPQEQIAEYLAVEIGLPPQEAKDRAATICKLFEVESCRLDANGLKPIIALLKKNNSQHGETALWEADKGANRQAWLIEENEIMIEAIENLLCTTGQDRIQDLMEKLEKAEARLKTELEGGQVWKEELKARVRQLEGQVKTAVDLLNMTLTPFETSDVQRLFYERRDAFLASVEKKKI